LGGAHPSATEEVLVVVAEVEVVVGVPHTVGVAFVAWVAGFVPAGEPVRGEVDPVDVVAVELGADEGGVVGVVVELEPAGPDAVGVVTAVLGGGDVAAAGAGVVTAVSGAGDGAAGAGDDGVVGCPLDPVVEACG
jgi:hypothetical protein